MAMKLSAGRNHLVAARVRRSIVVALVGVAVVGCSFEGGMLLLQLSETADQYFNSFDFVLDVAMAVDFAGKVLGSGGFAP